MPDTTILRRYARTLALAVLATTTSHAAAGDYKETLTLQGITFEVSAAQNAGLSKLIIKPSGLKAVNDPVSHDIEGRVVRAEVADIDSNGDPEIYVFTISNAEPKRGGVVAYAVNHKKSMSQIVIPDFTSDPKLAAGFVGGDESAIVETSFVTRFRIQNAASAGSAENWRQLQYKLKPGEAGWKLVLHKVEEF